MGEIQKKQEAYEEFCERGKEGLPYFDKYPGISHHIAFDAGYDSQSAEIAKLRAELKASRELLRQSLVHIDTSFTEGARGLYDDINAKLTKE